MRAPDAQFNQFGFDFLSFLVGHFAAPFFAFFAVDLFVALRLGFAGIGITMVSSLTAWAEADLARAI
jgi:hypothetical protein